MLFGARGVLQVEMVHESEVQLHIRQPVQLADPAVGRPRLEEGVARAMRVAQVAIDHAAIEQ